MSLFKCVKCGNIEDDSIMTVPNGVLCSICDRDYRSEFTHEQGQEFSKLIFVKKYNVEGLFI
jgi:hypothetical protein